MSSHCPNLVRIGCNAYFLSHITVYGVQLDPIRIAFNENVLSHVILIYYLFNRQRSLSRVLTMVLHCDRTRQAFDMFENTRGMKNSRVRLIPTNVEWKQQSREIDKLTLFNNTHRSSSSLFLKLTSSSKLASAF